MTEGKAFGNVVKTLLDGLEGYANAKTVINIVNDNESLSEELKDEILADILPLA